MKNKEVLIKQLTYQSIHRGCKETDIILGNFAKIELANLSDKELLEYAQLLTIDDAIFYEWFAGITSKLPINFNTNILDQIRKFHKITYE